MNPIMLIKNGIAYPIEKLGFIDRPFAFLLPDGKQFQIQTNEQPIFFVRKRARISGDGKMKENYIHRYCIGKKTEQGTTHKNWIYPNGKFDIYGDMPSN